MTYQRMPEVYPAQRRRYRQSMDLRHPTDPEQRQIAALVQAVVDEAYVGLRAMLTVPLGVLDWSPAWVAFDGGYPVGVALTSEEWIGRFGPSSAV